MAQALSARDGSMPRPGQRCGGREVSQDETLEVEEVPFPAGSMRGEPTRLFTPKLHPGITAGLSSHPQSKDLQSKGFTSLRLSSFNCKRGCQGARREAQ